jgi:DNA-directed RNA polymerase specialized sigma24 family protein
VSTQNSRRSPSGRDPEPDSTEGQSAFAAMLDEHQSHVFEYLRRLIGDDAEAASATQTAMNAAQSLLGDPGRLRAWLFALARQEIVTQIQQPGQDQDAEIRELVHRHGIKPQDLPTVLGISAEQAQAMLADADADIEIEAADVAAAADPDADALGEIDALLAAETTAMAQVPVAEVARVPEAAADKAAVVAAEPSAPSAPGEPAELDAAAQVGELALLDEPPVDPPSWIWDLGAAAFIDDSDTDPHGIPVITDFLRGNDAEDWAAITGEPGQSAFARARRRLAISAAFAAAAGVAVAGIIYLGGSPFGRADSHGAQKPNNGAAAPAVSSPTATPTPGGHAPPHRHARTVAKHHRSLQRVIVLPPAQPTTAAVPVTVTKSTPPTGVLTPPPHKHQTTPPPTIAPSPTPAPSTSPSGTASA